MYRALNFDTGFWKGFTSRVANWLLEKLDISGVGSYERNYFEKPSSVVVVRPLQRIVYNQMEKASSIGLTVATLTDCRLEDMECGRHQLVFASADNVLMYPFFSLMKKKKPHRFTIVYRFASNKLRRVNL